MSRFTSSAKVGAGGSDGGSDGGSLAGSFGPRNSCRFVPYTIRKTRWSTMKRSLTIRPGLDGLRWGNRVVKITELISLRLRKSEEPR